MSLALEPWLGLMAREYLDSFIPAGGSAVRFVVASPERIGAVADGLRVRGRAAGLAVVAIDTAEAKLHLLHNLYFAIAKAVDWEALIQARLERLVADTGYRWTESGQRMSLAVLAAANQVAPNLLLTQVSQQITRAIWDDARLALDFRNAMMALLVARLVDDRDMLRDAVLGWLRGELRSIGQVKGAQIGARISRHNARAMLRSLFHWLMACDGRGLLVQIDISRLLREKREVQDGVTYSPANVMDCYEVLRQMIDDADQMEGLFLAVLADPALLSDDPRRSLNQYTALKMRVWDDVRPQGGDNPLAPLVILR